MDEGERGDHPLVLEVEVILAHLVRQQHPLVDDGARREGRRVEIAVGLAQGGDPVLDLLADDEQLALERVPVGAVLAAADEDLAHEGFGGDDALAQPRIVDRHVAPAEHMLAFRPDELFDDTDAVRPRPVVARQEQHADAVIARLGQIDADVGADRAQMGIRHLDQDSRPVARQRVRADRAAVGQVLQNLQALLDDPVALPVPYVDDESDPARIVLVARVVEPLLPGRHLTRVPNGFGHVLPHSPAVYAGPRLPNPCGPAAGVRPNLQDSAASPVGTARRPGRAGARRPCELAVRPAGPGARSRRRCRHRVDKSLPGRRSPPANAGRDCRHLPTRPAGRHFRRQRRARKCRTHARAVPGGRHGRSAGRPCRGDARLGY